MADATAQPDGAKPGLGDLAEVFFAPSAVFARRADGSFGVPFAALAVLGLVIYFATKGLVQPVIDSMVSASIAKGVANGSIPADRADSAASVARIFATVIPLMFYLVGPFLVGFFLWIMGKITKVPAIGSVAIMVATFSMYPRLLGAVASAIIAAVTPDTALNNPAQLSFGPGHFIAPGAPAIVTTLAGRLDLFIIWGVVLMAIGLRVAGKATKGQAWTAAIGTWFIITLFGLLGAARQG